MMNVNHVHNKYLVVYYSVSGNTERVANLIENQLESQGVCFDSISLDDNHVEVDISGYKHVIIGSPTYEYGKTPIPVLGFLRYLLKDNEFKLPSFSVFGTGDTQWNLYCKAVDEMEYHLSKKTNVFHKLKIEQYPISEHQINKINRFVLDILGGK